jgi:lysine-specific histone demethylase 1
MVALRRIFGHAAVPSPLGAHVTAWETDPFALGTYSHIAVGATPADYDALAEPHGPVHFAGEATCSTHPATASGAYLSGLRAAGGILCAAYPQADEALSESDESDDETNSSSRTRHAQQR